VIITRTAGLAGRARVPQRRRETVGAVVDLLVLFSLVVCWVLIPAYKGHVAAGVALLGAVLAHLLVHRARWPAGRSPRRGAKRGHRWRVLLLVATAAMAASGLAQWAGVGAAEHWHAATSAIFVLLAGQHAWSRRQRLVRLRQFTRAASSSQPAG